VGGSVTYCAVLALAGAALMLVAQPEAAPDAPKRAVATWRADTAPARVSRSSGALVLKQAADNHFYVTAKVNGADVRFIVDTGSSAVVLSPRDALRAGIGAGDYGMKAQGAGGEVKLMPVKLARLTVGPLAADNVPAMVAERGLPVSLLGQSLLARFATVEIKGAEMILR
jgi:aspartyl protease family protein